MIVYQFCKHFFRQLDFDSFLRIEIVYILELNDEFIYSSIITNNKLTNKKDHWAIPK